jgi:hypothetical protein
MEAKGHVLIKRTFEHTKKWPSPEFSFSGPPMDLEKEYKEALAGKLVLVVDICVGDSGYLVCANSKTCGDFLWMIEKGDTNGFIPVIKENGIVMPAGMSPIEKFEYIAKYMNNESYQYKKNEK